MNCKKSSNLKKCTLLAVFAVIIMLFGVFTLAACNSSGGEEVSYSSYSLKRVGLSYDDDMDSVVVYISLTSSTDGVLESVDATWISTIKPENAFYNEQFIDINLKTKSIYSAVRETLTQEELSNDGKAYNNLKVVFSYDTIYKSIKSDAEIQKVGKHYLHWFELDEEQEKSVVSLYRHAANTASWYSVLAAAALIFIAALVCIIVAIRKAYAKKKK